MSVEQAAAPDQPTIFAPLAKKLGLATALLLCAALALYALTPNLEALKTTAVTAQETSANLKTFSLDRTGPGPHSLYIPTAVAITSIEAGSRGIDIAGSAGLSGFGLASQSLLLPLPEATTSVRVRFGVDHGRIGMSRLFLAPTAKAEAAAKAQRTWAWRNQVASMTVAVLSAFVLLTLIGSASPHFAPGTLAAIAYLVLAQALAREHAVGTFFERLIDGAEYLLAIWVAYALARALKEKPGAPQHGNIRITLLLLPSAAVFIPQPGYPTILMWLPAVLALPLVALAAARTWRAAADPVFAPVSLAAMVLALAAATASLVRAATPALFNETFGLLTLHSLGMLPLLTLGAVTLAVQAIAERRQTIAQLKADYAAQAAELGGVRASLQEEARKRMLFEERSRITRDMHDGIGGRLLSLLIRVRAGRLDIQEVEREVQESLDDLRLIVDSLDSADDTLSGALDAFRARAERQLAGAGMTLAWHEPAGTLDGTSLDPQATLNVLRILQEAVANAIRHAGAQSVSISFRRDTADRLAIAITDDGRGLAPNAETGRGKGLKNMKTRADRLGANFAVGSNGTNGCRVSIALPLNIGTHAPSGSSSNQPA